MANRACLYAEDIPELGKAKRGARRRTFIIGGAAYSVPVFWSFAYDAENLVEYRCESEDGGSFVIPALVSDMESVRRRLEERDALARSLFPQYPAVWEEWRQAVESVRRRYLKADLGEIWCLYEDNDELRGYLAAGLAWLRGGPKVGLDYLLGMAGIDTYDPKTRTFSYGKWCPEKFLYGWLDMDG
jgi:hypothetical protein